MATTQLRTLLLIGILVLLGCAPDETSDVRPSTVPNLEFQSRSGRVPDSRTPRISLLDAGTACTIDSYRTRVLCGDRAWTAVAEFGGGEGEGPGHFQSPGDLIRGPGETLGVVDYDATRLSFFDREGRLVETVPTPAIFRPLAPARDSMVIGLFETFSDSIVHAPVAWLSLASDSVVRSQVYRHPSDASRSSSPGRSAASGVVTPDGELVVWVGGYTLQRYDLDGEFIGEFTSPRYEPEFPSERDVETYAEGLEELFGREPSAEALKEFRNEPKLPLVGGGPMAVDSAGRLWVATTEGHEETSHLDLFRDGRYLGTVEVRGRLLWFDLLGSTLAVLTEGAERDSAGLYPRHIDWYRIGD